MKTRDYTGYSNESLQQAIHDALKKSDEHSHFEVIETRSSQFVDERRQYQATVTTFYEQQAS